MTNPTEQRPLRGEDLEKAIEETIQEVEKWKLSVIKNQNNTISKNNNRQVNHLSIVGGVRKVEYYPSKGTFYSNGIKGKCRLVRGVGLRDAIELAKNGRI